MSFEDTQESTGALLAPSAQIPFVNDDGVVSVELGLGASLFTASPWSAQASVATLLLDQFLHWCEPYRLGFYATETMSRHKPTNAATFSMPQVWLKPGAPTRDHTTLELKGGNDYRDASADFFKLYGVEPSSDDFDPNEATAVSFSVAPRLKSDAGMLEKLFVAACCSVDLVSAYAGYRLNCSRYGTENAETHALRVGMRYLGLDIPKPQDDAMAVWHDAAKGVGWLTAVGRTILSELGGVSRIRKQLPQYIEVIEIPTGAVIKLAPFPSVGDVNRAQALQGERAVSQLLMQHIERYIARSAPFEVDETEREITDRWYRRLLDV